MPTHRCDDVIFALSVNAARRGLLVGMASSVLVALLPELGHTETEAKSKRKNRKQNRKKRKRKSAQTPSPVSPPPPRPPPASLEPVIIVCPGPSDLPVTGSRRFAQIFVAPSSGQLTTAQCEVSGLTGNEDFTLEIRTVDGTGRPSTEVLASTVVSDVPATPIPQTLALFGAFNPPAPLLAGQRYALVVTIGAGQGFLLRARANDACPGEFLFDSFADGTFEPAGGDMVFSALVNV
jgi:hypothetical protein